ncbi:MAG: hypothetical protein LBL07_12870 [Tannerella sp.]|jgi:hypothetical protein|nr:hypothetical protein [Tannerella sp.]
MPSGGAYKNKPNNKKKTLPKPKNRRRRSFGSPVEEGAAQADAIGYEWTYVATQINESLSPDGRFV